MLATSVSLLPVNEEKIDAIMQHITTCRFTVKDGIATRYGSSFEPKTFLPKMPEVPNGTYEIQDGKASRIFLLGVSKTLPDDHPLLKRDPKNLKLLYNLGIDMDERYSPSPNKQMRLAPYRYAYFSHGDLYLMGSPIYLKNDPALTEFLEKEQQKQARSSSLFPYASFEDAGAPMTPDGKIDTAFIRQYGLKVPEKTYLVLGDNHAMSGDSRQFGFVPQDNLRGGASFLFWPPGPRWGRLEQPSTPHATLPNIVVWTLFLSTALATSLCVRRKYNKPLKFD
jgi:signal peptidase I